MSESVGTWLRQQRESRCWSVREMARRLRDAARTGGDTVPSSAAMANMIRRWERGSGMSERYRMHYCQAFGTAPAQFGGQAALPMRDVAETDCQAARQLLTAMTGTDTAEVAIDARHLNRQARDRQGRWRLDDIAAELPAAGLIADLGEITTVLDLTVTARGADHHRPRIIIDPDGYCELCFWTGHDVPAAQVISMITKALAVVAPPADHDRV